MLRRWFENRQDYWYVFSWHGDTSAILITPACYTDLCNNPLTHEPKLTRARRLIPEWDIYDKEVAELARQKNRQDDVLDDESLDQITARPTDSEIHSKDEL